MKSKILKCIVLLSALAFMNCDDSSSSATPDVDQPGIATPENPDPNNPYVPADTSAQPGPSVEDSTGSTTPTDPTNPSDPSVDPTTPTDPTTPSDPSVDPTTPTDPTNPSDPSVDPTTPADPATPVSSSSEAPAASSSSEAPAASSSSQAPASSSSSVAPAASSSSQAPASSSSEPVPETKTGIFLSENGDENKDQMEVVYQTRTGDNGGGVLAYPKNLSSTQKHGVVLWGPGGGTEPTAYEGIIRRLASHGFVVIATSESPDGMDRGKPALDWLAKKNETPGDPLYQKLDMTKVGASGHSMGGLQSEKMLLGDSRVITAVMNNSGAFDHVTAAKVSKEKTIAIVYGEGGMERPNAEGDYNGIQPGTVPACLLKMTGGQGNECQNGECGWGHGSGPWGGMAATVAWMRWHLGGEDNRKADFVGNSGKYIDGSIVGQPGKWKGQCKNF